jgi:hypothetical protein
MFSVGVRIVLSSHARYSSRIEESARSDDLADAPEQFQDAMAVTRSV